MAEGWVLRGKRVKRERQNWDPVAGTFIITSTHESHFYTCLLVPLLLYCHSTPWMNRAVQRNPAVLKQTGTTSTPLPILYGKFLCNHRWVLGLSVTARWKYSGRLSPCRLLSVSLWRTLVDRVFLKPSLPSPRFTKLDTIISARSCRSRWKFSLRQWREDYFGLWMQMWEDEKCLLPII